MYDLEAAHLRELLVDLQRARLSLSMLSVKGSESDKTVHRQLSDNISEWLNCMDDRPEHLFPDMNQVDGNVVQFTPRRATNSSAR